MTALHCPANALRLTGSSSESARDALRNMYTVFQAWEPNLTYQPCMNDYKCRGYYTHNFDTCSFVAQIWRLDQSLELDEESKEYLCEMRRTSSCGRQSFDFLLNCLAIGLKKVGFAKKYDNGYEIVPPVSFEFGDCSSTGLSSDDYKIELSADCANKLISRAAKPIYHQYCSTLRLLVKLSNDDISNYEVLMKSEELSRILFNELNNGSNASTCLNALNLIKSGTSAPREAFGAIARIMLRYCSLKPRGYRGLRSQKIENAALGALKVLGQRMKKKKRKEALIIIRDVLYRELSGELFRKVSRVFLDDHTDCVQRDFESTDL
jgi:hypothetical protein